jgi:hypothetical protein
VDLDEVVREVVERDGGAVVLNLPAESVGQSRIAPDPHAHQKVLAFSKASADMFWVRLANDRRGFASEAFSERVAGFARSLSSVAVRLATMTSAWQLCLNRSSKANFKLDHYPPFKNLSFDHVCGYTRRNYSEANPKTLISNYGATEPGNTERERIGNFLEKHRATLLHEQTILGRPAETRSNGIRPDPRIRGVAAAGIFMVSASSITTIWTVSNNIVTAAAQQAHGS